MGTSRGQRKHLAKKSKGRSHLAAVRAGCWPQAWSGSELGLEEDETQHWGKEL